eukprot:s813_g11.t1
MSEAGLRLYVPYRTLSVALLQRERWLHRQLCCSETFTARAFQAEARVISLQPDGTCWNAWRQMETARHSLGQVQNRPQRGPTTSKLIFLRRLRSTTS